MGRRKEKVGKLEGGRNGRTDRGSEREIQGWMDGMTDRWREQGRKGRWEGGVNGGRTDGRMGARMDGRTDWVHGMNLQWMDGITFFL